MGAVTAAALIGLGGSVYQGIKASQAQSDANKATEDAANNLLRIQQENKFQDLQVPTLGLELAQQNIQARQQQQIQGLQDIGAAGVLGGLTASEQSARGQDLQLAAMGQEAQYNRDVLAAQNAQAIEAERVGRQTQLEQQRLMGAQGASLQARNQKEAAIAGGASSLLNAAFMGEYLKKPGVVGGEVTNQLNAINPNATYQGTGVVQTLQPNAVPMQGQQGGQFSFANLAALNANPALGTLPAAGVDLNDPLNSMYNRLGGLNANPGFNPMIIKPAPRF